MGTAMAEGDYLPRVTSVHVVRDRTVALTFDDGLEGTVNLAPLLRGPMFEEIVRDDTVFGRVALDEETLVWPSGADLAPEALYDMVATVQGRARLPQV